MKDIFKLALRNLIEHKSKSIIIALFLTLGIAIVVMGNSFLESINRGLEKDFRENYTGDLAITIIPSKGETIDIFGLSSTDLSNPYPDNPPLPNLSRVEEIVASKEQVSSYSKVISAKCFFAKGTEFDFEEFTEMDSISFDDLPISMLFSGEQPSFFKMFKNINIIEGSYPEEGTNQVLIDSRVKKTYEKLYKQSLNIGDKIIISAAGPMATLREAVICGIFKPGNENSAMMQIIYCDPDLARSFAGLTFGSTIEQSLPDNIDLGLSQVEEDDLFSDVIDYDSDILLTGKADFNSILGDTDLRDKLNTADQGAWNYIVCKLKNPGEADHLVAELNKEFAKEELKVQALNWKGAGYSMASSVDGISIIFNLLVFILGVVVFIIIMNTMTVSVLERTSEIGTMRAIGAEKSFIKKLFFAESLFLTFISTVAGMILGSILMAIFNSFEITITNSIAKMILGGGLLHFSPTFAIYIVTVIVAVLCGFISTLYPVNSALRVSPLKALSKD